MRGRGRGVEGRGGPFEEALLSFDLRRRELSSIPEGGGG